jgi:hypothetical protein
MFTLVAVPCLPWWPFHVYSRGRSMFSLVAVPCLLSWPFHVYSRGRSMFTLVAVPCLVWASFRRMAVLRHLAPIEALQTPLVHRDRYVPVHRRMSSAAERPHVYSPRKKLIRSVGA